MRRLNRLQDVQRGRVTRSRRRCFRAPGPARRRSPRGPWSAKWLLGGGVGLCIARDGIESGERPGHHGWCATAVGPQVGWSRIARVHGADYQAADHTELQDIGDALALALVEFAEKGTAIEAGPMPMLAPRWFDADTSDATPGWRVSGSAGISMMYPVRRLAELLNQATTMEDIVRAARYCVMLPLRAHAWCSRLPVRAVCGFWGTAESPPGWSVTSTGPAWTPRRWRPRPTVVAPHLGRPALVLRLGLHRFTGRGVPSPHGRRGAPGILFPQEQLRGRRLLPPFQGPREFPPEERAIMTMLAGLLGAAVERVELSVRQHEVAECLQRSLLPSALHESPRLTISGAPPPSPPRRAATGTT